MAGLNLTGIRKSFGTVDVLKGIDLDVGDGEFIVFVGPSGCGKSTLLRVIAGLEAATAGRIEIDGRDVTGERASDRGLAMVFQSYALYPHMSVYRNIAFALENMGLPKTEIDARVQRAAGMLRLSDYLDRKPGALSGGQRQRVAIGRAVVRDPKIFLFDEPLSNLDAELRVVTHDQVEAMTLADRIVVLNAGRIEQIGSPLDLYNRPANRFVAGFIGSPRMNFIPGRITGDGGIALAAGGTLAGLAAPAHHGQTADLGIRPEHVEISTADGADAELTIEMVEQLGGESYLYGTLSDGTALTLRCPNESPARRGDRIPVRFQRERLHLFDATGAVILR